MSQTASTPAQWAQVAATLVVASVAAIIAWRQYRTAYDRFILDLFEKRIAVYTQFRLIISMMAQDGANVSTKSSLQALENEIQMLFGADIYALYLEAIQISITGAPRASVIDGRAIPASEYERNTKLIVTQRIANSMYMRLPRSFRPYLAMHQKAAASPKDRRQQVLGALAVWRQRARDIVALKSERESRF